MGMFPEVFESTHGAVPPWLTSLIICLIVLAYVFAGGVRSTAWANTFQTLVFMVTGIVAFWTIARALGGASAATQLVVENAPDRLAREGQIGKAQFFTYLFVPLSVGMFPHLFQHWLTAESARTFRLTVVCHPICIAIVWAPCILIGIWAAGYGLQSTPNAVLGKMLGVLVHSPILSGLLTAGILAAIMSSLDSQFMCMGTMFAVDIVARLAGPNRLSDQAILWTGRGFVTLVVALTYLLALANPRMVFDLGVWCFSGFGSLFPLVVAALYWRRATKSGAIACVLATTVTWLMFFVRAEFGKASEHDALLWGMLPVTFIFAASALALIVVSLCTKPPSSETVCRFLPSLETIREENA